MPRTKLDKGLQELSADLAEYYGDADTNRAPSHCAKRWNISSAYNPSLWIAHKLAEIAAYTSNICKRIIFMVER